MCDFSIRAHDASEEIKSCSAHDGDREIPLSHFVVQCPRKKYSSTSKTKKRGTHSVNCFIVKRLMLLKYMTWVRENEAKASSLEWTSRTMALVLSDPSNIVQMESMLLIAKLHALSNQVILSTANRVVLPEEKVSYIKKAMAEMECLLELALRQKQGHAAAWRFVVCWLVAKSLFSFFLKRGSYKRLFSGLVQLVFNRGSNRRSPAAIKFGGNEKALDLQESAGGEVEGGVNTAQAALVIPRVSVPRRRIEALGTSVGDYVAFLVDTFHIIRAPLLAFLAQRAFTGSRAGPNERFGTVMTKPFGTGSLRSPLKDSLLSNWRVWGSVVALEAVAAMASYWLKNHHVPLVTASRSILSPIEASPPSASNTGEPSSPTSVTASAANGEVMTVEAARLQACFDSLLFSFLRDPFFSVVLKEFVHKHFVDGFINKWIPFFGWILASQVSYLLTLQHNSFLFTIGPS